MLSSLHTLSVLSRFVTLGDPDFTIQLSPQAKVSHIRAQVLQSEVANQPIKCVLPFYLTILVGSVESDPLQIR